MCCVLKNIFHSLVNPVFLLQELLESLKNELSEVKLARALELERHSVANTKSEDLIAEHKQLQHDHGKDLEALNGLQKQHGELRQLQQDTQEQLKEIQDRALALQEAQDSAQVHYAYLLTIIGLLRTPWHLLCTAYPTANAASRLCSLQTNSHIVIAKIKGLFTSISKIPLETPDFVRSFTCLAFYNRQNFEKDDCCDCTLSKCSIWLCSVLAGGPQGPRVRTFRYD